MRHVLDASALIAYLGQERGHEMVSDLLARAADREEPLLMGAVNWGEAAYTMANRIGVDKARKIMGALVAFPIDVVPADKAMAERAGEFKTKKKLAYADGFAAALTSFSGGELLTADKDFESVKDEIRVKLIR